MATKAHAKVPWWAWPTTGYLSYTVDQLMACLTARALCPMQLLQTPLLNKDVKLAAAGQKKMWDSYLSFTPKEMCE